MSDDHVYHEKDALKAAVSGTLVTGSFGLLMSAVQNSMAKDTRGLLGVFTHTGRNVAIFAAMGGAYGFTRNASANLRRKDDTYNAAIGGLTAGSILGLSRGKFPAVLGFGALAAIVLATAEYSGGALSGYKKGTADEEHDRKAALRSNQRRPIEETVGQLGEGRGIYAPGYAERRRELLKEKYGIDVRASNSTIYGDI